MRYQLEQAHLTEVLNIIKQKLDIRLQEKGRHIFVSSHETLGVITEEFYKEYIDAIHQNDSTNQFKELLDITIACIVGMASIKSGKMDW